MSYKKSYNRIGWKNRPSTATALGATNLNHMDVAINTLDDRIVHLDATKLAIETANSMVKDIAFETQTGIVTITQLDGTVQRWNINLEKIPVSMSLTEDAVLILNTEDGLHYEADLKELIDTYIFDDSDTVAFNHTSESNGKHVTADVKNGSITEDKLEPTIMATIRQNKLDAESAAADALLYMKDAKSAASGGIHEGDETRNAKFYCEKAEVEANKAAQYSQIVAPGFLVDTESMTLYMKVGSGVDFIVADDNVLCWKIAS